MALDTLVLKTHEVAGDVPSGCTKGVVTRERARSSLVVVKCEDEASRNPDGSNNSVQPPEAVVSLEPETLPQTLGWSSDICILAYEAVAHSDGMVGVVHLCLAVHTPIQQ